MDNSVVEDVHVPGSSDSATALTSRAQLLPVRRRGRYSKEVWDNMKPIIRRLYSVENQTYQVVMEALRTQWNFTPTRRQFYGKIYKWRLQKNIKENEMRAIVQDTSRERFIGNDNAMKVRGCRVDVEKSRWEKKQERTIGILHQFLNSSAAVTTLVDPLNSATRPDPSAPALGAPTFVELDSSLCSVVTESSRTVSGDENGTLMKDLVRDLLMIDQTLRRSLPNSATAGMTNVVWTITFDRNFVEFESAQAAQDDEDIDPASTTPASSSSGSHPTASSISGTGDLSTERIRSSWSRSSLAASDSGNNNDSDNCEDDQDVTLQRTIRTVLRTDPKVAELLFPALVGKLECALPHHSSHFEDSGELDLLSLLELTPSSIVQGCGTFNTHTPSSSSGSSSSSPSSAHNQGGGASSSPNELSLGAGGIPNRSSPPNDGPGQLVKPQKNNARSSNSQSAKPHPLRCIHNALAPEIFCVNHDTRDRFRACSGPGWSTVQHLREHMQSHHTIKPNLLQCNRCQEEFKTQDMLKSHEVNVDCPIRCPSCREEFEKKALRHVHQEERHCKVVDESRFMEIDEATGKKIKDNLTAYSNSLRNGKGLTDPALEQWVNVNTDRYMIGRSSKANPRLELGKWYTIFSTLASGAEILEHPFYDYKLSPSDLIEERILLINEKLVGARIKAHGPPPSDLQQQRAWYQDALRESLKIAAVTRHVFGKKPETSSEQQCISNPSFTSIYSGEPSARGFHRTGFNLPVMTAVNGMTPDYQGTPTQESQVPSMGGHLSGSALPLSSFPPGGQPPGVMTAPSVYLSDVTSAPSSLVTGEMEGIEPWDFPQNIADGIDLPFDSSSNFEFQQGYDMPFEMPGSGMLGPPPYHTY